MSEGDGALPGLALIPPPPDGDKPPPMAFAEPLLPDAPGPMPLFMLAVPPAMPVVPLVLPLNAPAPMPPVDVLSREPCCLPLERSLASSPDFLFFFVALSLPLLPPERSLALASPRAPPAASSAA
jgi:hypothetical protein